MCARRGGLTEKRAVEGVAFPCFLFLSQFLKSTEVDLARNLLPFYAIDVVLCLCLRKFGVCGDLDGKVGYKGF